MKIFQDCKLLTEFYDTYFETERLKLQLQILTEVCIKLSEKDLQSILLYL